MQRKLPLQLPPTSVRQVRALKALSKGEASLEQQILAYQYLVKDLCEIGGLSFHADSMELTCFNEGRRHVGLTVLNLVETPLETLKKNGALVLTKDELQEK